MDFLRWETLRDCALSLYMEAEVDGFWMFLDVFGTSNWCLFGPTLEKWWKMRLKFQRWTISIYIHDIHESQRTFDVKRAERQVLVLWSPRWEPSGEIIVCWWGYTQVHKALLLEMVYCCGFHINHQFEIVHSLLLFTHCWIYILQYKCIWMHAPGMYNYRKRGTGRQVMCLAMSSMIWRRIMCIDVYTYMIYMSLSII